MLLSSTVLSPPTCSSSSGVPFPSRWQLRGPCGLRRGDGVQGGGIAQPQDLLDEEKGTFGMDNFRTKGEVTTYFRITATKSSSPRCLLPETSTTTTRSCCCRPWTARTPANTSVRPRTGLANRTGHVSPCKSYVSRTITRRRH